MVKKPEGLKVSKKETPQNTPSKDTPKNEVEVLKITIAKLEAEIKNQPKTLNEKIEFFKEKQEQMKKLAVLDLQVEGLNNYSEELKTEESENEFFTENFFFKISKKRNYSQEDEILTIQNPVLINEMIGFALDKINVKRLELQTAIEA
ncbi:MAG: hypothetical protein JXR07_19975 [Reichenbachiella sp.]